MVIMVLSLDVVDVSTPPCEWYDVDRNSRPPSAAGTQHNRGKAAKLSGINYGSSQANLVTIAPFFAAQPWGAFEQGRKHLLVKRKSSQSLPALSRQAEHAQSGADAGSRPSAVQLDLGGSGAGGDPSASALFPPVGYMSQHKATSCINLKPGERSRPPSHQQVRKSAKQLSTSPTSPKSSTPLPSHSHSASDLQLPTISQHGGLTPFAKLGKSGARSTSGSRSGRPRAALITHQRLATAADGAPGSAVLGKDARFDAALWASALLDGTLWAGDDTDQEGEGLVFSEEIAARRVAPGDELDEVAVDPELEYFFGTEGADTVEV